MPDLSSSPDFSSHIEAYRQAYTEEQRLRAAAFAAEEALDAAVEAVCDAVLKTTAARNTLFAAVIADVKI